MPKTQSGQQIANSYLMAIASGDGEAAWRLLHPSARKNITKSQFVKQISALETDERNRLRKWGLRISSQPAALAWNQGPLSLRIVSNDDGQWLVVDATQLVSKPNSPKLALTQFRQWILARNYGGILAMAPKSEHPKLSVEIIQARFEEPGVVAELVDALNGLIQSNDSRQTSPNQWTIEAGRHMAILALQDDQWRILDVR